MKLDLSSLYFNGQTYTPGNTASWGTSLGQTKDNGITIAGAQELVDLMSLPKYKFEFDPKKFLEHIYTLHINLNQYEGKLFFHSVLD